MAIKNLWSLNVDEVIVAEKIKQKLKKEYEVFFPINSHLKDIDLVVFKLKNGIARTVQVKGSKSYKDKVGDQYAWSWIQGDKIFNPTNKIDFFIFVWHVIKYQNNGKRSIEQAYIVIPTEKLKKICREEKTRRKDGSYHFSFLTDLKTWACDYPSEKNKKKDEVDFSKYLNNFNLLK